MYRRSLLRASIAIRSRSIATTGGATSVPKPPVTAPSETTDMPSKPPVVTVTSPTVTAPTADPCDTCACEEKVNDMLGSVKPYDRHVIICVPPNSETEWENDIDRHADVFPYSLSRHIDTLVKANKPPRSKTTDGSTQPTSAETVDVKKSLKVRVTAMIQTADDVAKNPSEFMAQVIVYPDNLLFSLEAEQVSKFADFVMQPLPLRDTSELAEFAHCEVPWKKLVLVCVHGARDKRCGRAGPQVIAELQRLLDEESDSTLSSGANTLTSSGTSTLSSGAAAILSSEVAVRGSSHIGGHVYAGTLIVYPEGQWYGRITKPNSALLLHNILNNTVYSKCSRGNTSSDVLQW